MSKIPSLLSRQDDNSSVAFLMKVREEEEKKPFSVTYSGESE